MVNISELSDFKFNIAIRWPQMCSWIENGKNQMLLVKISFNDYSQWANSSQTFSLLDQKAYIFVVILHRKKYTEVYLYMLYVQTLRRGFCLAGSISCPAASIHWLTAISSLSLMILMYSSAFWLPFWKFCSTKVMTIHIEYSCITAQSSSSSENSHTWSYYAFYAIFLSYMYINVYLPGKSETRSRLKAGIHYVIHVPLPLILFQNVDIYIYTHSSNNWTPVSKKNLAFQVMSDYQYMI